MSGSPPTVRCPQGHASSDTLICSVCGSMMAAAPSIPDMDPYERSADAHLGSLADKLGVGFRPDPTALPVGGPDGPLHPLSSGSNPVVRRYDTGSHAVGDRPITGSHPLGDRYDTGSHAVGDRPITGSHPVTDRPFTGSHPITGGPPNTGSHPVTGDTGGNSFSARTFGRNGVGDPPPAPAPPAAAGGIGGVGGHDGFDASGPASVPSANLGGLGGVNGPGAGGGWTCSNCSAELDPGARFCEVCGYDPSTGSLPHVSAPVVRPATDVAPAALPAQAPPSSTESWSTPSGRAASGLSGPSGSFSTPSALDAPPSGLLAVITADEDYYRNLGVEEVVFPVGMPPRTIELPAGPVSIGRRSRSRGTSPVIDLGGPPEDPAVSHTHASLIPAEDGTWRLVDHGSTNGTYLNESPTPVPANQPLPVGPGDRVYVGAWTKIHLERP